jgi:hypothetical protein
MKRIMKKGILLSALLLLVTISNAQTDKMKDLLEDTDTELNDGMLTLRFFDALSGEPVEEALVIMAGGEELRTDLAGKIQFKVPEDGVYHFKFKKEGYIEASYKFEVIASSIFNNRFTVSPFTKLGSVRIVLDWDRRPADLDLHLIKEGSYHLSFRDTRVAADGSAQLDRDDTNGYGPETITINRTDQSAIYTCYVVDYTNHTNSNSRALSQSKATVRVYNNNELTDTFYVNRDRKGSRWMVFQVVNGKVVPQLRVE